MSFDDELRSTLEAMGSAGGPPTGDWEAVEGRARATIQRRRNTRVAVLAATLVALAGAGFAMRGSPGHSGVTTISSDAPSIASSASSTSTTVLSGATSTPIPARDVGPLHGIQMVSPTVGFAIGEHGTIVRTDDAGKTWVAETQCGQAAFCGTADLTYLDMVNSMTGFAGGPEVALRTTDGQRWYEYTNTAVTAVHFVSPVEGWAVAATDPDRGGNIVHSTDGGMTWTVLPGTDRAQAVCFASPTDGWYSNADTLFRSTDGGASWTKSLQSPAGGDTGTTVALQCTADGGAWVQFTVHNGATGHIPYLLYSTQDAGSHWSLVFDSQFSFASSVPAPDGPGSQPGPFSIIDGATAFATGNTPAAGSVAGELVTNGSSLGTTRPVGHGNGFFASAASFISTTRGWVAGDEGGAGAIYATTDGGITWVRQL